MKHINFCFYLLFLAVSILVMFLGLTGCSKFKSKNGWKEYKLQGNVKTIKLTSYNAIKFFGKIEKGEPTNNKHFDQSDIVIFDERGNVTEEYLFFYDGSFDSRYSYMYDEENKVIEKKSYAENGSLTIKSIYKYDENNKNIEINEFDIDGTNTKRIRNKFNENGYLIEKDVYLPNKNLLIEKNSYKYDEEGNKIEEYLEYSYVHDTERKNSTFQIVIANRKQAYIYDANNKLIEEKWFEADGTLTSDFFYKYDSRGNLIEKVDRNRKSYKINNFIYDNKDLISYKYDFDNSGNWIRMVEFKNDEPQYITERKIEYFKN